MKRFLYIAMAALLTCLAYANVAFACAFHWYEPEVPSELR